MPPRVVRFGTCSIRYHSLCVSDNPAVSCGVAVAPGAHCPAIDEVVSVEDHRPLNRRRRPPRWIDPVRRRELLAAEGFSPEAIEAARRTIVGIQRGRIQSLPPLHMLDQLPWFVARSVRRRLRRRISSFSSLASLASSASATTSALSRDGDAAAEPLAAAAPSARGLGSAAIQASVSGARDVRPARLGDDAEVRTLSRRLGLAGGSSSNLADLAAEIEAAKEAEGQVRAAGAEAYAHLDGRGLDTSDRGQKLPNFLAEFAREAEAEAEFAEPATDERAGPVARAPPSSPDRRARMRGCDLDAWRARRPRSRSNDALGGDRSPERGRRGGGLDATMRGLDLGEPDGPGDLDDECLDASIHSSRHFLFGADNVDVRLGGP